MQGKYWQGQLFRLFGGKGLENGLIMEKKISVNLRGNFGNLPKKLSNLPMLSAM